MAEKAKARYRIIAFIGILAAIGAIVYGVWSAGQTMHIDKIVTSEFKGEPVSIPIDAAGKVYIEGVWNIVVGIGEPKLEIYDTADRIKNIDISNADGLLSLKSDQDGFGNLQAVQAKLCVPNLVAFTGEGASSITIDGVKAGEFTIAIKGPTSLDLTKSVIGKLDLSFEGAAKVDASSSSIANAAINLEGAGIAKLGMAGGTLSGKVQGIGKLEYTGSVSSESVQKEGLFSIDHVDSEED